MTPEAQRIAIAQVCGFTSEAWTKLPTGMMFADTVPDYRNDLNAIHETEKKLTLQQREFYWSYLARITEKGRMGHDAWLTTTATAAQRAEAFLKTIGKWID